MSKWSLTQISSPPGISGWGSHLYVESTNYNAFTDHIAAIIGEHDALVSLIDLSNFNLCSTENACNDKQGRKMHHFTATCKGGGCTMFFRLHAVPYAAAMPNPLTIYVPEEKNPPSAFDIHIINVMQNKYRIQGKEISPNPPDTATPCLHFTIGALKYMPIVELIAIGSHRDRRSYNFDVFNKELIDSGYRF